jgi:hypothetical protein
MALVLGVELEVCQIKLKRQSRQAFGIDWYNDVAQTAPSNLTGVTMTLILGTRVAPLRSWIAQNTANRSVWTLDEADTELPFDQYAGHLIMDDGTGETLLFRVEAEVEE